MKKLMLSSIHFVTLAVVSLVGIGVNSWSYYSPELPKELEEKFSN
ncbi:hypothetical protein [Paenibacillus foliorum]|nr:hypothetical protein [Paenibacillus foliorum]